MNKMNSKESTTNLIDNSKPLPVVEVTWLCVETQHIKQLRTGNNLKQNIFMKLNLLKWDYENKKKMWRLN